MHVCACFVKKFGCTADPPPCLDNVQNLVVFFFDGSPKLYKTGGKVGHDDTHPMRCWQVCKMRLPYCSCYSCNDFIEEEIAIDHFGEGPSKSTEQAKAKAATI